MKTLHGIVLIAAWIIVACTPPPAPPIPTPTRLPPKPTLVPVNLAPPMQTGSSMTYMDGALLVAVPSGPFVMGHGGSDDPQHTVTLSAFWIYASEVTNAQYAL